MQKNSLKQNQSLVHVRETEVGNRDVSLSVSLADPSHGSFSIRSVTKKIPMELYLNM